MKRTLIGALGALAFVFLCGFTLSMPAPASSIQGYPFCTTAPSAEGVLQYNGGNWCNTPTPIVGSILLYAATGQSGNIASNVDVSGHSALDADVKGDAYFRYSLVPGVGFQIGNGAAGPTTIINESKQWVGAPVATLYGGTGLTVTTSTVVATGTFTTSASVPTYRVIVLAGGGGGGSSTGAGYGGNGGTPSPTMCELYGNGTAYSTTVGIGGAAGGAGLTGTTGGASAVVIGTGASVCISYAGLGGTNGTASNGAGGATGVAPGLTPILDATAPANLFGLVYAGVVGQVGTTAGAAVNCAFGVCGGLGCAGASCATNTAGTHGVVYFIPEI